MNKETLEKLSNAPAHLISDHEGLIIGNSQALARGLVKCRELLAQAIDQLVLDYQKTPLDGHAALIEKLKSGLE